MTNPSIPWRQRWETTQGERSRLAGELLDREEEGVWGRVRETLMAMEELVRSEAQLLGEHRLEVDERINRQYLLRTIDLAGEEGEQADFSFKSEYGPCRPWLSADGRTLAFPSAHGPWASIRLLDSATTAWRGAIVFRVGEGWALKDFVVREDGYWLAGGRGEVFVVALDGSHFKAVYLPVQLLSGHEEIVQVMLVPPEYLWLEIKNPRTGEKKGVVLDLEKRNLRKFGELGEYGHPHRLTGSEPLLVWRVLRLGSRVILYGGAGHQALREEIKASTWIIDTALASEGGGWTVLSILKMANPGWITRLILSWVGEEGGNSRHATEFLQVDNQAPSCLATSRQAGCSFLYFQDLDGHRLLLALVVSEAGIAEQWRLSEVGDLVLLTDERAGRVMAAFPGDNYQPRLVELGRQPPVALGQRRRVGFRFDFGLKLCSCTRPPQARWPKVLAVYKELSEERDPVHGEWITRQIAKGNADELLAYLQAFRLMGNTSLITKVLAGLNKLVPDHPEMLVMRGISLVDNLRLSDLPELLTKVDWLADLGEQSEHLHHLLGMNFLQAGELDRAVEAWKVGLFREKGVEGGCHLAELAASVEEAWQFTQGVQAEGELGDFAWLLQSLQLADRYWQEGLGDKGIELLYCPRFWELPTPHAMARLARACLLREPRGEVEQLQWLIILSEFVAIEEKSDFLAATRPLPVEYRWQPEALDQLQEEAEQWIDTFAWD